MYFILNDLRAFLSQIFRRQIKPPAVCHLLGTVATREHIALTRFFSKLFFCLQSFFCTTIYFSVAKVGNCPLSCPITCPADHMFCPGRSITLSGETCQSEGICVAIPDPSVAGTCPAVCPTSCLPDELSCPLGVDSNGCDLGTQCIKQDPRCPSSAACPVQCADGDVRCAGGIDEAGCTMPDTCMPSTTTCPAKCPVVCNSEEKYCPMGSDPTSGCDLGGMCVPSKTANPLTSLWEVQADCETPCPVNCQPDQLTCTTGSIDGCNTGW